MHFRGCIPGICVKVFCLCVKYYCGYVCGMIVNIFGIRSWIYVLHCVCFCVVFLVSICVVYFVIFYIYVLCVVIYRVFAVLHHVPVGICVVLLCL